MRKENGSFLGSALALVLIFAVFCGLLFGVNVFAAPLIEKNGAAAALAPLMAVLPEAGGFTPVYEAENPADSTLQNVPETVRGIYAENSGLGYALKLSTSEGYTKEPMEITFGVDSEGKITGAQVDVYPETKDMGVDTYPLSYVGQDSTLADVSLVAGVSFSSGAFKNAIADGFAALIDNGLVTAGVKGDAQLLKELAPIAYPGLANAAGLLQVEETELEGQYLTLAMQALTGSGMGYIAKDGDSSYLVAVNAAGEARAFDVNGEDVTASVPEALLDEAKADAASRQENFRDGDSKAIARLVDGVTDVSPVALESFNSVTGAYLVQAGEEVYYGFSARSFGYSNLPLTTWFLLDKDGAIVNMNAQEFILIGEYFTDYSLEPDSYRAGFAGLTEDSYSGEQALIAGATISSQAVDTATRDVFEAFRVLTENGGVNHD